MGDGDAASYATICAYYKLATDPAKRPALCKDETSLQFLVYVLDSNCEDIVKTSLKTFLLISEQLELRNVLSKVFGLQPALKLIIKGDKSIDCIVLARKIYSRVFSNQSKALRDIHNTSNDPQPIYKNGPVSKNLPIQATKAKILVFQVKGLLHQDDRRECEEQMLKVRGLISITFSISTSRFVVRAKPDVKPEAIVSAIAQTETMSAQQVVKNESGQEVLVSFGMDTQASKFDKENSELPSYLSDDDSPVKEKALTRSGLGKKGDGNGWLSSAANFLSRSFYW